MPALLAWWSPLLNRVTLKVWCHAVHSYCVVVAVRLSQVMVWGVGVALLLR
jgi:hypothetical protein